MLTRKTFRQLVMLPLALAGFLGACQSTPDRNAWSFEIDGSKIESSAMPWAFHQALYELEYTKRATEKIAVNQFLDDAVLLAMPNADSEFFEVKKPTEEQLKAFHTDMKKFLPPDFASNRILIEQYYSKWQKIVLKKQFIKKQTELGLIKVNEPALQPRKFMIDLPKLPTRGSPKPTIEILVVSVLDCDICAERNEYLETLIAEYSQKTAINLQVLDSYPGDTSHPHYNKIRALICTSPTPAYWKVREALFARPDAVAIEELIAPESKSTFESCMKSNEPETTLARNNDLASRLYAKNLFSIYINQVKIAFPTKEIVQAKLEELLR